MNKKLKNQDVRLSNDRNVLEAFNHYNAGLLTLAAHLAADTGITLSEAVISEHLHLYGPLTPGELAKRARLSSGAVTALLDRLETRGFVVRKPNPEDRRSLLIHYVPQERELVGKLYAVMVGVGREMARLDGAQQETIRDFLNSVGAVMMEAALNEDG